MLIIAENFCLELKKILETPIPPQRLNEMEKNVLKLIYQWHSKTNEFEYVTSGSTGKSKRLKVSREKIIQSAKATMSYIDPKNIVKTSFLCLNPTYIGGAMIVYRALLFKQNLFISQPNITSVSEKIKKQTFDLTSMVPLQFQSLTKKEINQFKVILIGGAPMPLKTDIFSSKIYETFGMTETVSHIALRKISDDFFTTIGDNKIAIDSDKTMKIKGEITNNEWIKTNDLIDLISSKSFKWIGRKDFIINSGGIKINPEKIEAILAKQLKEDFIIGSESDSSLGKKAILFFSGSARSIDFSTIDNYERPKKCYFNCTIFKTASGKIDRRKTQQYFENTKRENS